MYPDDATYVRRFWSKVKKAEGSGCWEWQAGKTNGYGEFKVRGRDHSAHRFAYQITYGAIPDGFCVCHHCDNPLCVRPDHLFLGTIADNNHDASKKGRNLGCGPARGHGSKTKLTRQAVKEIRDIYSTKHISQRALAKRYGVRQSTIWAILHCRTW